MGPGSIGADKNAIQIDQNANVTFTEGEVTASGNTLINGTLTAGKPDTNTTTSQNKLFGSLTIFNDNQSDYILDIDNNKSTGKGVKLRAGNASLYPILDIGDKDDNQILKLTETNGLEITGDISGSGNLNINHITASGNISASGANHIFGGNVTINKSGSTSNEKIFTINENGSEKLSLDEDGDLVITGDFGVSDVSMAGGIFHTGDLNTSISFVDDGINFVAGGNQTLEVHPTHIEIDGNISGSVDTDLNYGGATSHGVKTFIAGDTTPDVSNGTVFLTNNSLAGNTTITGFDNGTAGQIIHVILNDTNTDFTNGTNLKLFRGLDYTSGQTNDISSFVCKDGTTWLELNRQDNS